MAEKGNLVLISRKETLNYANNIKKYFGLVSFLGGEIRKWTKPNRTSA